MATQTRRRRAEKQVSLRKVCPELPKDQVGLKELEDDLRRMGCVGLFQHSWRIRSEEMVRELVVGGVPPEFSKSVRGRPEAWTAQLWGRVYGLNMGKEAMAAKKDDCTRGRFSSSLDSKDGYAVSDCKDDRDRRMRAFLVPILTPEKLAFSSPDRPYNR